jgi:hypothetical protein
MIIISTHSINYIDNFLSKRTKSLEHLSTLLKELLRRWPELRFANDADIFDNYKYNNKEWFTPPSIKTIINRIAFLSKTNNI